MPQKKICMLGAFAVGKTSLVARFVRSMFSEKYHTTVGVKIDKKVLQLDGEDVTLVLWDIAGEDEFQKVRSTYLRGSAGFFFVADGTRPTTLEVVQRLRGIALGAVGDVPYMLALNKRDLEAEWELDRSIIGELEADGWTVFETSAKSGDNVEEAFTWLAQRTVGS